MQAKCIKQVTSGTSEAIRSMVQLAMSEGFEGRRFNKTTGFGIIDTFLIDNSQHATPLNLMVTCSINKQIQALCAVLRSLAFRNQQELFFSLKSCPHLNHLFTTHNMSRTLKLKFRIQYFHHQINHWVV